MKRIIAGALCTALLALSFSGISYAQNKQAWSKAKAEFEKEKDTQTTQTLLDIIKKVDEAAYPEKFEDAAKLLVELIQAQFDDKGNLRTELSVLDAAVAALSKTGGEKTQVLLLKEAKNKKTVEFARACVMEAMGAMPNEKILEFLKETLSPKTQPVLRIAALKAAGSAGPPEDFIDILIEALKAEEWQARLAAINSLGKSSGNKVTSGLINAFKDENGRLRENYREALKKITGADEGLNGREWAKWWEEKNKPAEEKKDDSNNFAKTQIDEPTYFDEPILSKSIVFIIDVSGSMLDPSGVVPKTMESGEAPKMPIPKDATPEQKKKLESLKEANDKLDPGSKINAVKKELANTILFLPEDTYFTIVFYSTTPFEWKKNLVQANATNKIEAVENVTGQNADGATNIFDSLLMAFDMIPEAKPNPKDDKKKDDKKKGDTTVKTQDLLGADTIYLLTDGIANRGGITTGQGIVAEISKMNLVRKIKIFTIGVGNDVDGGFLSDLAAKNGGKYIKVGQ